MSSQSTKLKEILLARCKQCHEYETKWDNTRFDIKACPKCSSPKRNYFHSLDWLMVLKRWRYLSDKYFWLTKPIQNQGYWEEEVVEVGYCYFHACEKAMKEGSYVSIYFETIDNPHWRIRITSEDCRNSEKYDIDYCPFCGVGLIKEFNMEIYENI